MRNLGFALALCLAAAGCKSNDASQPSTSSSAAGESASGDSTSSNGASKNRTGKIDLPQVRPRAEVASPEAPPTEGRRGQGPRDPARWEARQKERMAEMDTDQDGKVSDEERAAARKLRMEERMTRLDTNGDGKLTREELANSRFRRIDFDAADTNKDGSLSLDELEKAAANSMRSGGWRRRGEGAPPAAPGDPAAP
ncbi:MAG: hypothetical protein KF773_32865 [Deltaproteobacteria bacterium]|nr:hypothetical protein [Deltaproteobacteria bacterium]MCW5801096.1 hypothetical protein [Deltaproteobacteria bacterium]